MNDEFIFESKMKSYRFLYRIEKRLTLITIFYLSLLIFMIILGIIDGKTPKNIEQWGLFIAFILFLAILSFGSSIYRLKYYIFKIEISECIHAIDYSIYNERKHLQDRVNNFQVTKKKIEGNKYKNDYILILKPLNINEAIKQYMILDWNEKLVDDFIEKFNDANVKNNIK